MFDWIRRLLGRRDTRTRRERVPPTLPIRIDRQPTSLSPSADQDDTEKDKSVLPSLPIITDHLTQLPYSPLPLLSSQRKIDETAKPLSTPVISSIQISALPDRILFFDVVTTGLHSTDRIVSFAGISVKIENIINPEWIGRVLHIVCDPGKKSHPRAEEVHGYDDWTLRHQKPFSESVDDIAKLFDDAKLIVSHNIEFDLSFINREFRSIGRSDINKPSYCTMQAYRALGIGGSSSLNAVAARAGHFRQGRHHGALEDAHLVMAIYLKTHIPFLTLPSFNETQGDLKLLKLDPVPPRPNGALPRRKRQGQKVPPLVARA